MDDPAPPEPETEEERDEGVDLSTLRWSFKNCLADGVTFYGSIREVGWVLAARRLADVPVRFSLVDPPAFPDLNTLVEGLLAWGRPGCLGASRLPVGAGCAEELRLTLGEYPLYVDAAEESPRGMLRILPHGAFEIEVPWRVDFASWKTGRPLL